MPDLVALLDQPGPGWDDELKRWWDAGAAVLPVDHRLPGPAVTDLLERIRPTLIVDGDDVTRRTDGVPTEDGDALVVATSGTTGRPKGVVLTHTAVAAAADATNQTLHVDPDRDAWIACLPLAHVGGLGVVTRAMRNRTPLTIHPGFDAAAVTRTATAHAPRSTLISLVTTALRRIDPTTFRVIVLGGDTPPDDLPPNARVTYGMTETMGGCIYDGICLPGTRVSIIDTEVIIETPSLARAYRADGTETPITAPFATGDGGHIDDDGRLHVGGRLADLIVTGGDKVWPATVEAVLGDHPGVLQVAVVGRADPQWGHRVVARVVPADPADPPSLDDLRAAARDRLPAYALPRELELRDALPTTALGKVKRT